MSRSLTKADIVKAIYSQNTDLNRSTVKDIVEDMIALMKQAIAEDSALLLTGFGKFDAYAKKARNGRNPQTAETITLPPHRVVVFRHSRILRAELNDGLDD